MSTTRARSNTRAGAKAKQEKGEVFLKYITASRGGRYIRNATYYSHLDNLKDDLKEAQKKARKFKEMYEKTDNPYYKDRCQHQKKEIDTIKLEIRRVIAEKEKYAEHKKFVRHVAATSRAGQYRQLR